jgi:hypothetical protein
MSSDETKKPSFADVFPASPTPALQGEKEKPTFGAPYTIMKGGTTSGWMDQHVAMLKEDTAKRHAEQDAEAAVAKEGEGQVLGARRVSYDMGTPTRHPVVVLQYLLEGGAKERYIQCDVVIATDEAGMPTRVLNLVCPRCVGRGVPQAQAQIRIDDRNRRWYLDETCKGDVWIDPDTQQAFVLAGKVDCSERCRCGFPGCDFAFRISPKSDHPSVSRIIRE